MSGKQKIEIEPGLEILTTDSADKTYNKLWNEANIHGYQIALKRVGAFKVIKVVTYKAHYKLIYLSAHEHPFEECLDRVEKLVTEPIWIQS